MKKKGVYVVSSAILGMDCETVTVANKVFVIFPPTIERMAGAMMYLSELDTDQKDSIADVLSGMKDISAAAHALSWFVDGSDSLYETFCKGTVDEVVEGLIKALGMVSAQNFTMLSALVRNVQRLIARPKL